MNLQFSPPELLQYCIAFLDPATLNTRNQQPEEWQRLQHHVARISMDDSATATDISQVFAHDMEFCNYIIELANTHPSLKETVSNLAHAVMVLGTDKIRQIAETQSLWRNFN